MKPFNIAKIAIVVLSTGIIAMLVIKFAQPKDKQIIKHEQVLILPTPKVTTPIPQESLSPAPVRSEQIGTPKPSPSPKQSDNAKTSANAKAAVKTPAAKTPAPAAKSKASAKPADTKGTNIKAKIAPSPTPAWGKFTKEEYILLSTLIYYEASPSADLEAACAVGWVVRNRSESRAWGRQGIKKTIYRAGQFSVTKSPAFQAMLGKIYGLKTSRASVARKAAGYVLRNEKKYKLPSDVLYFHGDGSKRSWGSHVFYKEIGGNSFFKT